VREFDSLAYGECPVVFSKLSRVLNQEDALGAPCLGCDFCSPQGILAGHSNIADKRNASLDVTFVLGITESSRRHALMLSRQCTGNALRCRAKQGRREDDADVWILTFIVVRFLGRFREWKKFFGNHGGALLFHHCAISLSACFEYMGEQSVPDVLT
jgi:hypothetical protein